MKRYCEYCGCYMPQGEYITYKVGPDTCDACGHRNTHYLKERPLPQDRLLPEFGGKPVTPFGEWGTPRPDNRSAIIASSYIDQIPHNEIYSSSIFTGGDEPNISFWQETFSMDTPLINNRSKKLTTTTATTITINGNNNRVRVNGDWYIDRF